MDKIDMLRCANNPKIGMRGSAWLEIGSMRIGLLCVVWTAMLSGAPFAAHAMDLARVEARVDAAVTRFGVDGQGVIVALLDRGIDWKNDDFRNEDGTTRIKWIFDLTDDTGANDPGNTYGIGTIYTEAQINAALTNGTNLATRDAVGQIGRAHV